jgi:predicted enzyme related to lactoylglutathione lyase
MDSIIGKVAWVDLSVVDAPRLRDFYKAVIGWEPAPVNMGDYDDFSMQIPGTKEAAVGICHARGQNAHLAPQWLIYVPVANLKASVDACERLGGKVVCRHSERYTVIEDPAGAVMMLCQA